MLTDDDKKRLAEIEAREKAATPGPWTCCSYGMEVPGHEQAGVAWEIYARAPEEEQAIATVALTVRDPVSDADFLACARTDIPWLLELVKQLAEERSTSVWDLWWKGTYYGAFSPRSEAERYASARGLYDYEIKEHRQ